MGKKLISIIFDWDTLRGAIGSFMAIVLPFIKILTPLIQLTGASLGVVLAYYSIQHVRIKIKNEKNDTP